MRKYFSAAASKKRGADDKKAGDVAPFTGSFTRLSLSDVAQANGAAADTDADAGAEAEEGGEGAREK